MRSGWIFIAWLLSTSPVVGQDIKTVVGGNRYESTWVLMDGEIREGAAERLSEHLQRRYLSEGAAIPTVVLNSPGGVLVEGLKIGLLLRSLKATTQIGEQTDFYRRSESADDVEFGWVSAGNAICASACAYAFLGGVDRYMVKDGQFGLHQFYHGAEDADLRDRLDIDQATSSAQFLTGLLVEYIDTLGDISFLVLQEASKATSSEMNWLTRRTAIELSIIRDDLFEEFYLEPYGAGIVAASRATTSETGYDNSRVYYQVSQATTFCRDGRKYLMLSSYATSGLSILDESVMWYFEFEEGDRQDYETIDNVTVRTTDGRTYLELDVTEVYSMISNASKLSVVVPVPRYQGGNLTFEKDLTEAERSFVEASFRICI
jgi:hypothetical protein